MVLASVNVQFNDLAFQRCKGGCIRSLTAARNYHEFLFDKLLLRVSFFFVFDCLLLGSRRGRVHEPLKRSRRLMGGNWEQRRLGGHTNPTQETAEF